MALDRSTRLDGDDLRGMFSKAAELFERSVPVLNALNVFPVPDGDTGTNMMFTLRDLVREAELVQSTSAGEVAAAMASGSLRGSRGNSGVILSQFFKGMAVALDGGRTLGLPSWPWSWRAPGSTPTSRWPSRSRGPSSR